MPTIRSRRCSLLLAFRSFILSFVFGFTNPSGIDLCVWYEVRVHFSFRMNTWLTQHLLLKCHPFEDVLQCHCCHNWRDHLYVNIFLGYILFHWSVFSPVPGPQCLSYYSFRVSLSVYECKSPGLFFFSIALVILNPLFFFKNFRIISVSKKKNKSEILIGIILHL